eukprot:5762646-Pyramimonas_sp.AAC.1
MVRRGPGGVKRGLEGFNRSLDLRIGYGDGCGQYASCARATSCGAPDLRALAASAFRFRLPTAASKRFIRTDRSACAVSSVEL